MFKTVTFYWEHDPHVIDPDREAGAARNRALQGYVAHRITAAIGNKQVM